MKIRIAFCVLIAFAGCFVSVVNGQTINVAESQTELKNDDILVMIKSGLSAEIIVAKIKSSNTKFDTSPNTLAELKELGVPDPVILAMVESASLKKSSDLKTENGPKDSKAKIYVYRKKEFSTRNMQPSVYVDGTEVARIDDGKYFIVKLEPGKHKIFVNKEFSGAEIDMKAGEEYYFRVSMKSGFWKAHGEVEYVPKEQGTFEMNKMSPLEPKWIKDKSVITEDKTGPKLM